MKKQNTYYMLSVLLVFVLFVGLGKWRQLSVLTNSEVSYQTKATNLKTQKVETFQVTLLNRKKAQIDNLTTKDSFEGDITRGSSGLARAIRFVLPNDQGILMLRAGLLPWSKPELVMATSTSYEALDASSKEVARTGSSSASSSATVKDQSVAFSADDIQNLTQKFGQWLYDSDYGKDAVVVSGLFSKP